MTEIEKNLKKMADEIPVPEKLLPDQIEKKLKNNRKKPHRYVRGVCVAAAAVIVVGAGVMMWQNQKMSPQKQQTTAEQYQKVSILEPSICTDSGLPHCNTRFPQK